MDNFDAATDSGEGWLANPDGCPAASKKKFSNAIDFWFVDGDKALLYSDDSDGQRVSLRYAASRRTAPWPRVQPIQRQIDRMFAILPNYEGVMFSITSNTAVGRRRVLPEATGRQRPGRRRRRQRRRGQLSRTSRRAGP